MWYDTVACSMMSDWKVELVEDNISEFYVDFSGPKDSEYGCLDLLAANHLGYSIF